MVRRQGTADLALDSGQKSGRLVIEAKGISKAYGENEIFSDLSLKVVRGDRIALVGPNGAGKTTLINVLIGKEASDTGTVRRGTGLELAVFDQQRETLDPDASLWDTLASDPELGVGGRSDQIMVRGTPRHVVGYLKDFLFDEAQARAPVRALSGGERARLLLAKRLAKPANLLVLDEPTNDLDVETLDLLQELLADFDGTVLLVSHDRDFLDRVATATLALEGDGKATLYPGGWSDYRRQRPERDRPADVKAVSKRTTPPAAAEKVSDNRLTFTEKHRLEELPGEIARLEAEIAKLSELLSDPNLYSQNPVKFQKATDALGERQKKLAQAEDDWLRLEEKAAI
ncbi:MAG: ATP-binding cassette domain-containing protein, partial [Pseudomonadota bacterium]